MPYIGHSPTQAGTFYIIDDLTMSSSTGYNMQVGGVDVTPNVDNLLITLDGVVQHPGDAYTVSGSTLTFASGPGSGVDFFGIIMGQSASFGEGSIGADELKVTGDGSSGQVLASDGDGTFTWTTDTENYLPLAGGALTGAVTTNSTFDGVDIATRDAILSSTTTTAGAALPKAGGAMTGAITTNSTFDGVDIATRDAILTSTTTTAGNALPKAGGTMTGTLTVGADEDGHDVTLYGTTTGRYMLWDESADTLILADNTAIKLGTGSDLALHHTGSHSYIDHSNSGELYIRNLRNSGDMLFQTTTGAGATNTVILNSAGNVGIGTNAPATQMSADTFLEIKKASGIASLGLNGGGDSRWELTSDTGDDFKVSRNGSTKLTIDGSNSNATFAGNVQANEITTAASSYSGKMYKDDGSAHSSSASYLTFESMGDRGIDIRSQSQTRFYTDNANTLALTLDASQNATFAGEITVAGGNDYSAEFQKDVKILHAGGAPRIIIGNTTNANDYAEIAYNSSANTMRIGVQGDESTIVLDSDSNTTFAGVVTKSGQPSFRASTTSNPSNASEVIWQAVHHNRGSHYNSSNGRFTAPVDGRYLFMVKTNVVGRIDYYLRVNGTTKLGGQWDTSSVHTGGWFSNQISCILELSANDYVSVYVDPMSSSWDNGVWNSFSGHMLS